MNYAIFNAVSPFEIGDKIIDQNSRRVYEITDIMCVHRLRAGTVSFKYELNHSGRFVELEPAERTKERAVRSEKIENARAARSAAQEAPAQHQHDGKNIKILIADESTHLPAEFTQFIKHRFG